MPCGRLLLVCWLERADRAITLMFTWSRCHGNQSSLQESHALGLRNAMRDALMPAFHLNPEH
jgi:hypothetical protein